MRRAFGSFKDEFCFAREPATFVKTAVVRKAQFLTGARGKESESERERERVGAAIDDRERVRPTTDQYSRLLRGYRTAAEFTPLGRKLCLRTSCL